MLVNPAAAPHNTPLAVKGRDRCTLMMNPADAAARALSAEEQVRIESRVGHVVARLVVTDEVMPGAVSLPHGWGHHREGMRLRTAFANAGVSMNDLCDDQLLEPVVGNAVLNGVPVQVMSAGPNA